MSAQPPESGPIPAPLAPNAFIHPSAATSVTTALSFSSASTSLTRQATSPRMNVSPIFGGSALMWNSDSPVGNRTDTICEATASLSARPSAVARFVQVKAEGRASSCNSDSTLVCQLPWCGALGVSEAVEASCSSSSTVPPA